MRIRYDRDKDILLLELSHKKVDFAEEAGPIIVHFSKERHPVMFEILDASGFLSSLTTLTMKTKEDRFVKLSI